MPRKRAYTIQSTLAQLAVYGFPAPIPEYRFHTVRKWRLDYAWPLPIPSIADLSPEKKIGDHEDRDADNLQPAQDSCDNPLGYRLAGVALEIEGVSQSYGRHQRIAGLSEDAAKYNVALLHGWLVFRATQQQIASGLALIWLEQALKMVFPRKRTNKKEISQ